MENVTPRQLIERLQSLLKERKHNSETPLQAFIDYIMAERQVIELLLRIPQDSVKSEDHLIAEEIPQNTVKSEDHLIAEEVRGNMVAAG
jgi:hypothetical protein